MDMAESMLLILLAATCWGLFSRMMSSLEKWRRWLPLHFCRQTLLLLRCALWMLLSLLVQLHWLLLLLEGQFSLTRDIILNVNVLFSWSNFLLGNTVSSICLFNIGCGLYVKSSQGIWDSLVFIFLYNLTVMEIWDLISILCPCIGKSLSLHFVVFLSVHQNIITTTRWHYPCRFAAPTLIIAVSAFFTMQPQSLWMVLLLLLPQP